MRFGHLILLPAVLAASFAAVPQTSPPIQKKPVQKKTAAKKTAPKSTASSPAKSSAKPLAKSAPRPGAKTASKTAARRKGKSPLRPAATPRQATPTPQRYKEIQQALVDKGYLKSEPNGVWDADSTEALRQFQTDQKLAPTGKITAPALIGLGLGPKNAVPTTGSVTPPPAEPPKP